MARRLAERSRVARRLMGWIADARSSGTFADLVKSHAHTRTSSTAPPSNFVVGINSGLNLIPSVALPIRISCLLQAAGLPCSHLIAILACSQWPTVLNEALNVLYPKYGLTAASARLWLIASGIIVTAMFISAAAGWRRCLYAAPLIGDMLATSPNRAGIEKWLNKVLSWKPQYIASALTGILACVFLYDVRSTLQPDVDIGLCSYIMVCWVGIIAANVVYWLCMVGDFPRRLRRCNELSLLWHDPAMTPGLVALCDAYVFASSALSIGVVMTEAAAIALPNRGRLDLLNYLAVLFPILAGAVALWAAAQPFFHIYLMTRDSKRSTLSELDLALTNAQPADYAKIFDLYFQIRTVSLLPVTTATIVQYLAAIIGVVGGLAAPKLVTIISGIGG